MILISIRRRVEDIHYVNKLLMNKILSLLFPGEKLMKLTTFYYSSDLLVDSEQIIKLFILLIQSQICKECVY